MKTRSSRRNRSPRAPRPCFRAPLFTVLPLRKRKSRRTLLAFLMSLGAFAAQQAAHAATITVNTTADSSNPNDGVTSLREAITLANGNGQADNIVFAQAVFSGGRQAINVGGQLPVITSNITITAPPEGVIVQTTNTVVNEGVIEVQSGNVTLTGLTLTSNLVAFLSRGGNTTIQNSTIRDSSRGVFVTAGAVTVRNSTLTGNSLNAIFNSGGTVDVRSATITGNNNGIVEGAAVPGTVTVSNSIIAGNTNTSRFTDNGSNINGGTAAAAGLDPNGLAENGGPTQTYALGKGSPAVDAGASTLTTDQRGLPRPARAAVDIGAFEVQNQQPVVSAFSRALLEDGSFSFAASDFSGAYTDPENDALQSVRIQTLPAGGTLRLNNTAVAVNQVIPAAQLGQLTFTPTPNFNGSTSFNYNASDGFGFAANPATITLNVTPVNDAPSFTLTANPDQTVNEDATLQTVPGFVATQSPGPANESAQTVSFNVTNNNNALFLDQPTINAAGTLSYTPAPDAFGTATVTVQAQDDGGTANGGADTSPPQTFTITVNSVNDAPTFTIAGDQTVNEDAGAQTVANFVTSSSPGPANESAQTIAYLVSTNNTALFTPAGQPTIDANGTLTYTPAPDANGTATVTVRAQDDGGTANGGADTSAPQTFTITVNSVNDDPTISGIADQTTDEDTALGPIAFSIGDVETPPGQLTLSATSSDQTVVPDGNIAFGAVDASGNTSVTVTPAPDANGVTRIVITVTDADGGTAQRGFNLTVNAVNDAPSFTLPANPNQSVANNAGRQTVPNFATNISPGPANESAQTVRFVTTAADPTLFALTPRIDATGTLRYTPAAGAVGSTRVSVRAIDSDGATSGSQFFTIAITSSVNQQPTISPIVDQTTAEDTATDPISFVVGDAETPAGQLTLSGSSDNQSIVPDAGIVFGGTGANRTVTVTPAPDANGTANITVTVTDADGAIRRRTFALTVTPVNDAPTVAPIVAQTTDEDTPRTVNVTVGDVDNAAADLTVTATSSDQTVVPNANIVVGGSGANRTLTITPAPNASGAATITVRATDPGGLSSQRQFVLTVNAVNDAPTISGIADSTTDEDTPTQPIPFTIGDAETPPAQLTLSATSSNPALVPVAGIVFGGSGANRTVTVTPAPDASGVARIVITVTDGDGATAQRGFNLTVNANNDAPVISAIAPQTTLEDTSAGPIQFAVNDVDGPNDPPALTATSSDQSIVPDAGIVITRGTGNQRFVTITPAPNAAGNVVISIVANDGLTTSSRAFNLTVTPVNDAPSFTLSGGNQTTPEDSGPQTVTGFLTNISPGPANEGGAGGQIVNFIVTNTNPALFSVQPAISRTGVLTYTPAPDAVGTATVNVRARDNGGVANGGVDQSGVQSFTISVAPVNDAPTIGPIANTSTLEDTPTGAVPFTVADIDSPPNSITLSGTSSDTTIVPNSGIVFGGSGTDRTVTVTPASDAAGTATITVVASDGAASSSRTFEVTVTPVNDAPSFTLVATPDQTVAEDSGPQSATVVASSSAGPANESGQTLNFVVTNDNAALFAAQPTISRAGVLTYTPVPDANGTARVRVVARDNGGTADGGSDASAPRFFDITVTPVNDAPTVSTVAAQTTPEDTTLGPIAFTVDDIDDAPGSLTVKGFSSDQSIVPNGNVVIGGSGANRTVTITPAPDASGTVTIALVATDAGGATGRSTFTLDVTAVNDAPTIAPIAPQTTDEDTATTVNFAVDDVDNAPGSLTVTAASSDQSLVPDAGIVVGGSGANRTLTITPAPNANGSATITITATDAGGLSSQRQFVLTVNAVNDAPTISAIGDRTINEDTSTGAIPFTVRDVDNASGTLTLSATSSDTDLVPVANITFGGGGGQRTVTVTPAPNFSGSATITVTVRDAGGLTASSSFVVTVNPVNDAPAFTLGGTQTVNEDAPSQVVRNFATVTGPTQGQSVSFAVTNNNPDLFELQPQIAPDGTLTYQPAANANGSAIVTVRSQATNAAGTDESEPQTFQINVNAVNDAPTFAVQPNATAAEDGGAQTVPGFVTAISPGPANESAQTVSFVTVVTENSALFSVQPQIAPNGTLTFTPAPDANGTARVRVVARDSGGTDNGGANTSAPKFFNITVSAVNDAPTIGAIGDQTTLEDTPTDPIAFSVDDIDNPPASLTLSGTSSDTTLVPNSGISFGGSGANRTVTVTPAPDAAGTVTISVTVSDGTATATRSFDVTITPVNDAPSFTLVANPNQTTPEDSGAQSAPIIASASAGPANESGQTGTYLVNNDNNALFSVQPKINTAGVLTYTPAPDANGVATVRVRIRDNGGTDNGGVDTSAVRSFTITVTPVNDAPTIGNVANQTTPEDTPTDPIAFVVDDIDTAPGALTVRGFSSDQNIVADADIVIGGSGAGRTVTVTPAPNASGNVTITLIVNDGQLTSRTSFVLTVAPVNDAPTIGAIGDQTTLEDTPTDATSFTIGDIDSPPTSLTLSGTSSDTTLVPNSGIAFGGSGTDRTVTVTPAPNAAGTATITVTVSDGTATATRTFSVTVTPVNDAPNFVVGDDVTVAEDSGSASVANFIKGVNAGPANETGQTVSYLVVSETPSLFAVQPQIAPDGTLTFTPAPNASGTARIRVRAKDDGGTANGGVDLSAVQFFSITVAPVNDAPTISPINNLATFEDTPTGAISFTIDDIDNAPGTLTLSATSSDTTLVPNAGIAFGGSGTDRTVTITPAPDAAGTATITVTVSDGTASSSRSFDVTVTPVNDAPSFTLVAAPNQTVAEDAGPQSAPIIASASAGPANETGQTGTYLVSNDNAALFAVQPSIDTDGVLTYTPAADANGVATVSVRIRDNGGTANGGVDTSATQTFTITVTPVNDAPTISPIADTSTPEDTPTRAIPFTVRDVDNAPGTLGVSATSSDTTLVPVGNIVFGGAGVNRTVTVTPAANLSGTATITLTVRDAAGLTATSSFVLTVDAVSDAPDFTVGAAQSSLEDAGAQTVPGFVSGISPMQPGQTASFVVTNDNNALFSVQPAIAPDGTLTYTAAPDANGSATVTVRSQTTNQGGTETSEAQSFTISIVPVNDAPAFIVGDDVTVAEDSGSASLANFVKGASAGPANETGQSISYIVVNDNNGLFAVQPQIAPGGTLTFTLAPNANGVARVNVRVRDSGGTANGGVDTSAVQTFTLAVTPNNDAPTIGAIAPRQTLEDTVSAPIPFTIGDVDNAVSTLQVSVASSDLDLVPLANIALSGTDANRQLVITPARDANGVATITVTVSDGEATSTSSFDFTVTPVNDAPSLTLVTRPDQTVDEDAGPQSVQIVASASAGPANESAQTGTYLVSNDNAALFAVAPAIDTDGILTYTPAPNASGVATVTVRNRDNGGTANGGVDLSPAQTFTITVNPVNDAPVGRADSYEIDQNGTLTVSAADGLLANDSDVDSPTLTAVLETPVSSGKLTLNKDGSFTYVPVANFNGTASFTYRVSDGALTSEPVPVSIVVNPISQNIGFGVSIVPKGPRTNDTLTATPVIFDDSGVSFTYTWTVNGIVRQRGESNTFDLSQPNQGDKGDDVAVVVSATRGIDKGTATNSVTVLNSAPFAFSQIGTARAGVPTRFTLRGADFDNEPLTFKRVGGPTNGTATLESNGDGTATLIYTARADFGGVETIRFVAVDELNVTSTPATLAINVTAPAPPPPANRAPVATNVTGSTQSGREVAIPVGGSDPDGDPITFKRVGGPRNGTGEIRRDADGRFKMFYLPRADFVGQEVIRYVALDDKGKPSPEATITINVTRPASATPTTPPAPSNRAPVATNVTSSTVSGAEVKIPLAGFDPDGDPITFKRVGGPVNGTGEIRRDSDGVFKMFYTPRADFVGRETIRYVALDDKGKPSAEATMTIEVSRPASAGAALQQGAPDAPSGGVS